MASDALRQYKSKRNFSVTAEPAEAFEENGGKAAGTQAGLIADIRGCGAWRIGENPAATTDHASTERAQYDTLVSVSKLFTLDV